MESKSLESNAWDGPFHKSLGCPILWRILLGVLTKCLVFWTRPLCGRVYCLCIYFRAVLPMSMIILRLRRGAARPRTCWRRRCMSSPPSTLWGRCYSKDHHKVMRDDGPSSKIKKSLPSYWCTHDRIETIVILRSHVHGYINCLSGRLAYSNPMYRIARQPLLLMRGIRIQRHLSIDVTVLGAAHTPPAWVYRHSHLPCWHNLLQDLARPAPLSGGPPRALLGFP